MCITNGSTIIIWNTEKECGIKLQLPKHMLSNAIQRLTVINISLHRISSTDWLYSGFSSRLLHSTVNPLYNAQLTDYSPYCTTLTRHPAADSTATLQLQWYWLMQHTRTHCTNPYLYLLLKQFLPLQARRQFCQVHNMSTLKITTTCVAVLLL